MKTTIIDIVSYWKDKKDESSLGVEWEDAHERCWRCGYKSRLERCHIIPKSLGGSDEAYNLIVLCKKCHKEAPNINDSNFIWNWIENDHGSMYDTYWTIRAFTEFENIFGRQPFSVGELKKEENIPKIIKEKMQNAITHFGESRFNTSTLACIIKSIEDEVTLPQGCFDSSIPKG